MIKKLLQNARKPDGWFGGLMVKLMNKGHSSVSEWGLTHLNTNSDSTVLDIGCGGGANIKRLLQICPEGFVSGIDFSATSVSVSRKTNSASLGKRCDIIQGSVSELPYDNEHFDVVTAFETVYFWPDLKNDFSEVFRVLKNDGKFLICNEMCDPADTTWSDKIEGMILYDIDELVGILTGCGFTIEITDKKDNQWGCVVAQKVLK